MHEVEVSAFVPASPVTVERVLTPTAVVEYEGSFEVRDVTEREEGETVTAGARGLTMRLDFEAREDGLCYRQRGEEGPFDAMETRISVEPADGGSRVTATSEVSLGLPLPAVSDRVAAWKRRSELRRALDALAEDV